VCMPPPLPRCSGRVYSSLKITPPYQPSPVPLPVGLHIVLFEACSAFTHVTAYTFARSPIRDRYPKASDTSSPPCLLRLLPAGASAGRGLHPPEKRRLFTAHVDYGHSRRALICGVDHLARRANELLLWNMSDIRHRTEAGGCLDEPEGTSLWPDVNICASCTRRRQVRNMVTLPIP
jgi:hypothetical protein